MIALLQKTRLLATALLERMRGGRPPNVTDELTTLQNLMDGRRFGAPLTRFRAAVPGLPIGGEDGKDIQRTFEELREDIRLLYEAQVNLSARVLDLADLNAVRRDRLTLAMNQLRLKALTLLAQASAGSKNSIVDSFNTLQFTDNDRTTARVDLDEGVVTLPPNSQSSVKYDGTRSRVTRTVVPPNTSEPGASFQAVFSPYRLDAWYVTMPVGSTYEAHLNVTGADYEQGASEEVLINAIRIEPTSPLHIEIQWSPEGFNWHALNPAVSRTIRDRTTFYFEPVRVGFLRFRIRHSEELSADSTRQIRPVGIKRIELFKRGFNPTAQFFSTEHRLEEPVHTVVAELEADVPLGTRIEAYVARSPDGPWQKLGEAPVTFDVIEYLEQRVSTISEEDSSNPATMWEFLVPSSAQPINIQVGEMVAGRDQIQISAYKFDWRNLGDREHIPQLDDWENPLGEVRSGVFAPAGALGSEDITDSSFVDLKNPVGTDSRDGDFTVFPILQGNGSFVLQPGYNYRVRAYVWCPAPVTLERQRIGVVNPAVSGGTAEAKIAPLSLFVNGRKIYQNDVSAASVATLSGSQYQATIPFLQGWNSIELLVQLPANLTRAQGGLASGDVYIYLQPNLFASNREEDLGIRYLQAYKDPWPRYSEFDLRYNVPFGRREAWAWKLDVANGIIKSVLFNHDVLNSANNRNSPHPSFVTLDGQNAGYPVDLILRYPSERPSADDNRVLFFRADLFQDPGTSAPPVLRSYRLIVN